MTHPLVEVLEGIVYDRITDMEADGHVDFDAVFDLYKARASAVFEARDLAVAKAVRNACLDEADLFEDEAELIRNLDLNEIIKGVK